MAYPEETSQYAIYSTNYQYHILELCSYISTSTTYQNIIAISPELAYRKIQIIVVPFPSSLSIANVTSCRFRINAVSASPSPAPPFFRLRDLSII